MVELAMGIGIGLLIGIMLTYIYTGSRKSKLEQQLLRIQYELQRAEEENSKMKEIDKHYEATFKNLANEILDKKMSQIKEINDGELVNILKPLEKDLKEFRDKIDNTTKDSIVRNTSLVEKIMSLEKLGLNMTEETKKLTKALKSDTKAQGIWGELILERILEQAGLREGIEYIAQGVGLDVRDEDNIKLKPDFVVMLPDNKHVIIDSKVPIKYYEEYVNAENDADRSTAGKGLVTSIRNHIVNLESKHYERREGVNSPDFVLMFIPIDNIFNIIGELDPDILRFSWSKKVAIVTPITVMYILWLISYIWKQENQSKNVAEIAKKSGEMYDKFVLFTESLNEIGNSIDKSKSIYEKAVNQLYTGKGNLIKRADEIKNLGADNKKNIDTNTVS